MASPGLVHFVEVISRILGWIYTLAWTLSFYPQPLLNYQRQSTIGVSPAFPMINFFGFFAYLVSTSAFYGSPLIRDQYAARNPLSPEPTVRFNDMAFVLHAFVLSAFAWSMFAKRIWGFKQGDVRVQNWIFGILAGCFLGVSWSVIMVWAKGRDGGRDPLRWAWIDVIYGIGYCKLVITAVKYIPQIYTHYQNQSTEGWNIEQILLDLTGGTMSISQLLLDSSLQDDWSGITGNPVKLGLGSITVFFDIIFMCQHYVLYHRKGGTDDEGLDGERRRLLANDSEPIGR